MEINGYPIVYMPDRDDTIGNSGCVYVHILVAEKKLGRRLLPGEVVHHVDGNKSNFSEDNLIVFKTKADHARFHKTGSIEKDGDVYVSPKKIRVCKKCGKQLPDCGGAICIDCYRKQRKEILENKILENKEQIYEMDCEGKTVKQIAESLGLIPQSFSDACRRLNIIYKI